MEDKAARDGISIATLDGGLITTRFEQQMNHLAATIPDHAYRGTATCRVIEIWLPRKMTDTEKKRLAPHLSVIDEYEDGDGWHYGLEGHI